MTTYEFRKYIDYLTSQVKSDKEQEMKLAGLSRLSNMMNL